MGVRSRIQSIEDIHMRCVCDDETGCWSFRRADGSRFRRGAAINVWLGDKSLSLPRAVWMLKTGQTMQRRHRAYRTCDTWDCANPDHIRGGSCVSMGRSWSARGLRAKNAAQMRRLNAARSVLTPELRRMIIESPKTGVDLSAEIGISRSVISSVRVRHRRTALTSAPSVFHLADGQAAA